MNKTSSSPKVVNPPPPAPKTWTVKSDDGKLRNVSAERMHISPGGDTLVFMNGNDIVLAIACGFWFSVELENAPKAQG